MNTVSRLGAIAGAALFTALLGATLAPRPAQAADVVPEVVAARAFAAASAVIYDRPHTARILSYADPAETQTPTPLAIVVVAVWEAESETCHAIGVYVQHPEGPDAEAIYSHANPTERGTCWVAGLTELPIFA